MKLFINPKLLPMLQLCPLFVQYNSGKGRVAGKLFGVTIQLCDIRIKLGRHHFGIGINREATWKRTKREFSDK